MADGVGERALRQDVGAIGLLDPHQIGVDVVRRALLEHDAAVIVWAHVPVTVQGLVLGLHRFRGRVIVVRTLRANFLQMKLFIKQPDNRNFINKNNSIKSGDSLSPLNRLINID